MKIQAYHDRQLYLSYCRIKLANWKHRHKKKIHAAIGLAMIAISILMLAAISNPELMSVFKDTDDCRSELITENGTVYQQDKCDKNINIRPGAVQ